MKKMLFIMNPYSGKRRANRYLVEILEMFNRAEYLVTVHMTAGPGDATQVVKQLAPGMDIVVCCGGDGTFNETVAGAGLPDPGWLGAGCGHGAHHCPGAGEGAGRQGFARRQKHLPDSV